MSWIIILALFLACLILFILNRYSHAKRINQNSYAVYLLLNDEIREDHKQKFIKYVREKKPEVTNATELALEATNAIEAMADRLAESNSILAARSAIWNCDQEDE